MNSTGLLKRAVGFFLGIWLNACPSEEAHGNPGTREYEACAMSRASFILGTERKPLRLGLEELEENCWRGKRWEDSVLRPAGSLRRTLRGKGWDIR